MCDVSDLVAESLARALAVNCTLEELNISDNEIGDNGIGHIGTALLTNTTLKILNIDGCVLTVSSSLQHLGTGGNHMNGRVHICTALQKNTTLKKLYFSDCGLSDLGAESLARALAVNSSLEVLDITNESISDNGFVHIAKSFHKNNTLKVLYVGMPQTIKELIPETSFTDAGVLSLARGVATNTSMEYLSIEWFSADPESTLKIMASSVKKSSLKTLSLRISCTLGGVPAVKDVPAQEVGGIFKARKWYRGVKVGGEELIMSLEDSHLESLELSSSCCLPRYMKFSIQLQTAIDSVNSARHKKGLQNIHFNI